MFKNIQKYKQVEKNVIFNIFNKIKDFYFYAC